MSEIRTLLNLELLSLYGVNKALHTKDKSAKTRYCILSVAFVILALVIFTYVGALVYGLCTIGLSNIVPAYLTVIASLLILFFGFFTAGSKIFTQKGYDILVSMPIKPKSIVISRFLSLYIEDLIFTSAIMLPGIVTYGVCKSPTVLFYVFTVVGTLFIPAIPAAISLVVGTLIYLISSRVKNKSVVQTVLMLCAVLGVFALSFTLGSASKSLTPEYFAGLADNIYKIFKKIYLPSVWLGDAAVKSDILSLALFAAVSTTVTVVTVFVLSKVFNGIMQRLGNFSAKHNYKIGTLESRSALKALYLRELKRYFSSSIYVTNTIVGPILALIMTVALAFTGTDMITDAIPIKLDAAGVMPFMFAAVFCMMPTTPVSLSMEGKNFWVIKSMPVTAKDLLDSKILLNLSLMLPCYILSEIAMTVALKPSFTEFLWLLLIPALIIFFSVIFGITVNLRFHSFDWENETSVVKQSLPAALGGFAPFFLSIILGVILFIVPTQLANIAKTLICVILCLATALIYQNNNKKKLEEL